MIKAFRAFHGVRAIPADYQSWTFEEKPVRGFYGRGSYGSKYAAYLGVKSDTPITLHDIDGASMSAAYTKISSNRIVNNHAWTYCVVPCDKRYDEKILLISIFFQENKYANKPEVEYGAGAESVVESRHNNELDGSEVSSMHLAAKCTSGGYVAIVFQDEVHLFTWECGHIVVPKEAYPAACDKDILFSKANNREEQDLKACRTARYKGQLTYEIEARCLDRNLFDFGEKGAMLVKDDGAIAYYPYTEDGIRAFYDDHAGGHFRSPIISIKNLYLGRYEKGTHKEMCFVIDQRGREVGPSDYPDGAGVTFDKIYDDWLVIRWSTDDEEKFTFEVVYEPKRLTAKQRALVNRIKNSLAQAYSVLANSNQPWGWVFGEKKKP